MTVGLIATDSVSCPILKRINLGLSATGRRRLGEFYTLRLGQFFFRSNPVLKSMALHASTFLKELESSFLDFFSRGFFLYI
jgi:hypothetical protein